MGVSGDVGTREDLAVSSDHLYNYVSVVKIDTNISTLPIIDSEVIVGLANPGVYVSQGDIYLYSSNGTTTNVFRIRQLSNGSLTATEKVEVPGSVSDSRWLSEYEGILRIATNVAQPLEEGSTVSKSIASIYTVGDSNEGWRILGQTGDLADGQQLLSVQFYGQARW